MKTTKVTETLPVKAKVSKEDQLHIDARDARVKAVQSAIDAAKVVRDEAEKNGITETPGKKIDREAKEAKDLAEAGVLNKIEPFNLTAKTDLELNLVASKLNEVITYLNK